MHKKQSLYFLLVTALCILSIVLSLRLGSVPLTLSELYSSIINGPTDTAGFILWYSRLPRTVACLLAGAALSVSGCVLQSVLGNHLASPGIIGVNAGAGLAVTLCCAFVTLSGWGVSIAAFCGAMAAVVLVIMLAKSARASRTTIILAGVAMNSIFHAFRDAVMTLVPESAMLSGDFRVGGFSAVVSSRLLPAGILIGSALLILLTMSNELDVLSLGEETAQSLGLRIKPVRTVFLLLSALLAGAAVSFAGLLGFVGLLIPHASRTLIGTESRRLMPFCAVAGAGFVTICDLLSRLMFMPYELPVGILLSVIGGPFFLVLLLKRKGKNIHA